MRQDRHSQKSYILAHLRKYGFINPMIALNSYGCFRLGARISDLRSDGHNIITERTRGVSAVTGNDVYYATYRLIEP